MTKLKSIFRDVDDQQNKRIDEVRRLAHVAIGMASLGILIGLAALGALGLAVIP